MFILLLSIVTNRLLVKEAFAFGEEYCKAVTASNPPPVQLKLEKVYSACLLQTVGSN